MTFLSLREIVISMLMFNAIPLFIGVIAGSSSNKADDFVHGFFLAWLSQFVAAGIAVFFLFLVGAK